MDLGLETYNYFTADKPPTLVEVKQALVKINQIINKRKGNTVDVKYRVDQMVCVKLPKYRATFDSDSKFQPRYSAPKRILRFTGPVSVELFDENDNTLSRLHVSHLKPYQPQIVQN